MVGMKARDPGSLIRAKPFIKIRHRNYSGIIPVYSLVNSVVKVLMGTAEKRKARVAQLGFQPLGKALPFPGMSLPTPVGAGPRTKLIGHSTKYAMAPDPAILDFLGQSASLQPVQGSVDGTPGFARLM
jgi:hypothetical protein